MLKRKNTKAEPRTGVEPKQHTIAHLPFFVVVLILAGLTLLMFGDVLFTSNDTALSSRGCDLTCQFMYWLDFGFTQLRHGNLALWNPHIYSGAPFFGGFQSALLYPPNAIYLFLPLAKAINWAMALHVFLAGLFMYLWVSYRGLHPLAGLLSGILFMFGGAYFLHVFAGHLPHLCAMIWAPLIFLCIDGICREHAWGWSLVGMLAVAMSILAGHPQYVFFTFVAAAIYSFFSLHKCGSWKTATCQIFAIYAGAAALGAIQLFAGFDTANETVRSGGMPYDLARRFSFPWENLLTLLTPKFFGDDLALPYWGKWLSWEMNVFVGITGLFLAVYGVIHGDKKLRRFSVIMTFILLGLALGSYTPLYGLLYSWVPGFNQLRGMSKFNFLLSLFLLMLSGVGFDHLLRNGPVRRSVVFVLLGAGIVLVVLGLLLRWTAANRPTGPWRTVLSASYAYHQSNWPIESLQDPQFILHTGLNASTSLFWAALTIVVLAALLFLSAYSRKWLYMVALLAVVEVFLFARTTRPAFSLAATRLPEMEKYLASHPGDYRFFFLADPDISMSIGGSNLWGYDPFIVKRYGEFIFFTQGQNPDEASPYPHFVRYDPLYAMLRCRFFFSKEDDAIHVKEIEDAMPRLQLMSDCRIVTGRDRIFAAMRDPSFNPREKVILESNPEPPPAPSKENGTAKVLDSSTDSCTIEADLSHPAILLMTDLYCNGWRARALPGSAQQKYDLLPANYVLRAISLSAGHHHLRVEYRPKAYVIGKWVSIFSVAVYAFAAAWYWLRSRGRLTFMYS